MDHMFLLRLPLELWHEIQEEAKRTKRTYTQMILWILEQYFSGETDE